jgi:radical SAM protein with 4Fe4S-binding SPASM domain
MTDVLRKLRDAGLASPKMLTFSITGACNLRCAHCWVRAGVPASAGAVAVKTVLRVIDEFACLAGDGIRFTGGEPLCHPDWLDIVRHASGKGFRKVSLQTNAMLFTDSDVRELEALDLAGLELQISVDGASAASHDLVRGVGAYAGVMDGLRRLTDGGFGQNISLSFTEMRHNLAEFPALLELADSLGIGSVVAGTLVSCGRAEDERLVAAPATGQYLELIRRYNADVRFRALYERIGSMAALEWQMTASPREEECSFAAHPYLNPDGMLYPCVMCQAAAYAVSGVMEKGLSCALVEGVPLWSALAQISRCRMDSPLCRDCPGRLACAGGCMGRAWASCGDLMAVDDRCPVRQIIYQRFNIGGSDSTPFVEESVYHSVDSVPQNGCKAAK